MNTTSQKMMSVALVIGSKNVICDYLICEILIVISYSIKLNQVYNLLRRIPEYGNIDNRGR